MFGANNSRVIREGDVVVEADTEKKEKTKMASKKAAREAFAEESMKETVDLIAELDAEARNSTGAGIVLDDDDAAIFVFANDPARVGKLHDALTAGGTPIGIIGFDLHDGVLSLHNRAVEVDDDFDDAQLQRDLQEQYLDALAGTFRDSLKAAYPDAAKFEVEGRKLLCDLTREERMAAEEKWEALGGEERSAIENAMLEVREAYQDDVGFAREKAAQSIRRLRDKWGDQVIDGCLVWRDELFLPDTDPSELHSNTISEVEQGVRWVERHLGAGEFGAEPPRPMAGPTR
ncbi:MAG: hypothetical protein WA741_15535 [Candidatus Sulfotelmatobacter sp.]